MSDGMRVLLMHSVNGGKTWHPTTALRSSVAAGVGNRVFDDGFGNLYRRPTEAEASTNS